jgi:hypothetical protein
LHLQLWHLLLQRQCRSLSLQLLLQRPLAPRLLLLPRWRLRCGKLPHL